MKGLLAGLRAFGPARLVALAAVALACLGLLGAMVLRNASPPMGLLYADLDLREAGQVTDQLTRARIPFETDTSGSRIMVPADQVARARMMLAKDGLPSGGSIGNELFDRADGLTASAFQQGINQARALEGELARTIRSLQGVRTARVHLVLPRREPFARDRQEAQASVVLGMNGAARLDRDGVQAVVNLVAAAVPGLKPQNIAIVDSRGNLLARAGQPVGAVAAAQAAEEMRHGAETRLARAVEEMLERTVGPGRVRAEAAIELDYDQVRETHERFDPEGQVIRSQQSSTGNSRNTEAPQNVSVQNNLPNAEPATGSAGSQEQKSDETTNYEISKTVRTVVREQPQMKRLSLAVMVDGVALPGADGKPVWSPRPEEELSRIASLVRSAVGFDEKRGDKVEVVSMRFTTPEEPSDPAAIPFWARIGTPEMMRLGETGMMALVALLALTLVFRPMVLRLTMAVPRGTASATVGADGVAIPLQAGGVAGTALAGAPGAPGGALPAPGTAGAAGGDYAPDSAEAMMQLANVQGELRAASIRRVTELVQRHPEASLAMIRGWIAEEDEP